MKKTRLLLFGGILLLIGVPILIAQNAREGDKVYKEDLKFQQYKKYQAEMNKQNLLDLPGLELSGDKTVDAQRYEAAKKKFIQQNPGKYKQMVTPKGKYLEMPGFTETGNAKKDAENYEKAKMEWKEANPETYNKVVSQSQGQLPEIPGFKSTGIPAADQKLYEEAKEKWAAQNPEAYQQFKNQHLKSKNK